MAVNDQGFGFMGFASHAAAQMVIAALTDSTDGGNLTQSVLDDDANKDAKALKGMVMFWSKNDFKAQEKSDNAIRGERAKRASLVTDESERLIHSCSRASLKMRLAPSSLGAGLNFSRVRYPPDSRSSCWFCLASPTCEKHLLVNIGGERAKRAASEAS